MSISIEAIDRRIKEIDEELEKVAAIQEEREELVAAKKVMMRYSGDVAHQHKAGGDSAHTPDIGDTGVINLDDLVPPAKVVKSKDTLYSNIENLIIERFGDQEFTVNHVAAALNATGKGSEAKHFKNRISLEVKKLAVNGVIDRTEKGSGNIPHKYRKAKAEPEQEKIKPFALGLAKNTAEGS